MNVKKVMSSVVILLLIMVVTVPFGVYAVNTQSRVFGIQTLMQSGMGYSIGKPSEDTNKFSRIWNIVEYTTGDAIDNSKDIYCLKAGAGTLQATSDSKATYDRTYDMKTSKDTLANQADNNNLKQLATETISVDGNTVSKYDAVLAAFDMFYVKGQSNRNELIQSIIDMDPLKDESDKLKKIMERNSDTDEAYKITEDEIKAVQQAVIWYFTNHDEKEGLFDQTADDVSNEWFQYTTSGNVGTYNALVNYESDGTTDAGKLRYYQVNTLYKNLIKKAIQNASKYANIAETSEGAPAQITKPQGTTLEYEVQGENYIVGPIKIEETDIPAPYNIELIVNNGETPVSNYKLLDSGKKDVTGSKNVESLVGEDFYISVPKASATDLTVNVKINYTSSSVEIWACSTNHEEQPLAIPTITPNEVEKTLTLEEKPFDLALRKYIIAVSKNTTVEDDEYLKNPDGTYGREPKIDTTYLEEGTGETTARYNHMKYPVAVKTGDIVTYNITIYNEGGKDGRATRVIDQLPTGLKFLGVVSGNFVPDTENAYDEAGANKLYLVRKSDNTENLSAYTTGKLDSETITIQCEVTQKPDDKDEKILTNVAWIAAAKEEGVEASIPEGTDRDSQPSSAPDVNKDSMSDYKGHDDNKEDLADRDYHYKGEQDDDDFEKLILEPESFDLKLIKRITGVNQTSEDVTRDSTGRIQSVKDEIGKIQSVDVSKLNTFDEDGKRITTADYKLSKEPVEVKKGDIVTYTFRIYNEGTVDGYAQKIMEDVPEGLEFLWSEKQDEALISDTNLTQEEKQAILFNRDYYWQVEWDEAGERVTHISSDYLSLENETIPGENLIKAFGENDGTKTEKDLSYKEISARFKVISDDLSGNIIRNEAAITEDSDANGDPIDDRDSTPGSDSETWKKEPSDQYYDDEKKWPVYKEDDEDYDNVILTSFDLVLRKFIIAVSKDTTIENKEYLKEEDGSYTREPKVDASKLNTKNEAGETITTADYKHIKEPVPVQAGDYVVYTLRVYNEGDKDGYASEIKDHLPPYLKFVDCEFNKQYGWTVSEDGKTVTTTYFKDLKDNEGLIKKAHEDEESGEIILDYKDVQIMCQVEETAYSGENITNIADITEYLDENKNPATDRDSGKDNVELPREDDEWPTYNGEDNKDDLTDPDYHYKGQQDDDDFEKLVVGRFDLALRKFITQVEDKVIDTRIPHPEYDEEIDEISYNHTKDPVDVVSGNTVTYTIRVFNEGTRDGYAAQILDDIPSGLEFLPEHETNQEYRWKMYRSLKSGENVSTVAGTIITQDGIDYVETTDVSEAEVIVTDYLSKEQGEARMEDDEEITQNPNLLKAFDEKSEISDTNPDNKDVKVAFKVVEPDTSDKTIENQAQISKDTDENGDEVDDDDSTPGEWNDREDDQDDEFIKLRYFDLALRKWVTQAIVIEDGKETVTQTGHDAWDDPEQVVKVEVHRKKTGSVVVKFRYSIRVYNQGDIEGYAKEITDYVPQGLKFVAEDNPGWTDEGNNVISTRLLEDTLLKPGDYADVEVLFTWINGEDNMGVMTNTAEISEDYNEFGVPDIDSTPDNKKSGEDDIDDAPVMLSVSTGQLRIYFTLGFTVLITLSGGVILIKKYIL